MLLALAAVPCGAQVPKQARIGVLFYNVPMSELEGPAPTSPFGRAVVEGLRERGWLAGQNARIYWRSSEGRHERLPALVRELLDIPVDVIVASGNDIAALSVRKSPGTPVVLGSSDFPVENGLVASLARPGGSITGLTNWVGTSLNAKRLSLLKEAVPSISTVAIFGPPGGSPEPRWFFAETQAAADSLGIRIVPVVLDRVEGTDAAFAEALRAGANAILVLDYPFAFMKSAATRINQKAHKHKLPVLHSASTAADAGSLLTFAPDIANNFRRAGYFVDKILRGAKPADLPIEQPDTLQLVVDLKAARAMGIKIAPSVITQATRIIE
jgi:putative ABC transport system substrate-binding protein